MHVIHSYFLMSGHVCVYFNSKVLLQLNKHMGYQDIKKFASLLRLYREDNMHVTEFCGELEKLYGEDRKFLIPG